MFHVPRQIVQQKKPVVNRLDNNVSPRKGDPNVGHYQGFPCYQTTVPHTGRLMLSVISHTGAGIATLVFLRMGEAHVSVLMNRGGTRSNLGVFNAGEGADIYVTDRGDCCVLSFMNTDWTLFRNAESAAHGPWYTLLPSIIEEKAAESVYVMEKVFLKTPAAFRTPMGGEMRMVVAKSDGVEICKIYAMGEGHERVAWYMAVGGILVHTCTAMMDGEIKIVWHLGSLFAKTGTKMVCVGPIAVVEEEKIDIFYDNN